MGPYRHIAVSHLAKIPLPNQPFNYLALTTNTGKANGDECVDAGKALQQADGDYGGGGVVK